MMPPPGSSVAQVGQVAAAPAPIARVAGVDAARSISWVLITVSGRRLGLGDSAPPLLTAQCSQGPGGKLKFELLATDPASTNPPPDPAFQGPWQPTKGQLFPPALQRVQVTMEFLGYTRVKPVKRQWEHPDATFGLLRYATPSTTSSNMESIAFYLQYLRALPTLRLTTPGAASIDFETSAWLLAVKAEPLCRSAGL